MDRDINAIDTLVNDSVFISVTPAIISSQNTPLKVIVTNKASRNYRLWDTWILKQLITNSSGKILDSKIEGGDIRDWEELKSGDSKEYKIKLSRLFSPLQPSKYQLLTNIDAAIGPCKCFARSNTITILEK